MRLEPSSSVLLSFCRGCSNWKFVKVNFKRTPSIEGVAGGSGNSGSRVPYSQINVSREYKNLFKKHTWGPFSSLRPIDYHCDNILHFGVFSRVRRFGHIEIRRENKFRFWEDCAVGFLCFCDDSVSLWQELAELNNWLTSSNNMRFRIVARDFLCCIWSQSKSRNTMMIICQLGKGENWQGKVLLIGNTSRKSASLTIPPLTMMLLPFVTRTNSWEEAHQFRFAFGLFSAASASTKKKSFSPPRAPT